MRSGVGRMVNREGDGGRWVGGCYGVLNVLQLRLNSIVLYLCIGIVIVTYVHTLIPHSYYTLHHLSPPYTPLQVHAGKEEAGKEEEVINDRLKQGG